MADPEPSLRRVAILAAGYPSIGGGGVIRIAKLAKYLPPSAGPVTVICSQEPLAHAVDESLLAELPPAGRVVRLSSPLLGLPAIDVAAT